MASVAPETGSSSMGVLKIRRDLLEACMMCQICHKLVTDATAISECLHIFCRKCIFERLTEGEVACCPICNIDLGCNPFEKLRPDHNIKDIREKIFPSKKEKEDAGTLEVPSVALLVAETPRLASQGEFQSESSNSFATRRKTTQTRRQNNCDAEDKENEESYPDRPEQRTPVVEADQVSGPDAEVPISSAVARARRLEGASQRRREPGTSALEQLNQYWFSLVAAADLEGCSSLNQSPARYLRLTDGNLPVSCIQKYLARKLDIANESEVEIMCQGQTVSSVMTLQNVADLWFQTLSSDIIQAPVGSSGKDLVIVLVYRHKVPAS
ncbi:E3 ubiquitin protein ligase DRIP2-like [Phoenix dactylifera]|uniref:E3 ubiquitin protein ligase DRIP2-like n=1 Tax=Phoenix dactylifera TaxID=42345 RepID=A0A8B9ANB4_PHODC|nr:E3 ubiquitin protein ligase DRIP2-like [Phoenix dactylifera]